MPIKQNGGKAATPIKLALLGGDLRQMVSAKALAADGYEIAVYGMDTYAGDWGSVTRASDLTSATGGADMVVLPLPITQDGERLHCPLTKETILLSDVFSVIPPNTPVAGGKVTPTVRALAAEHGITVLDYLQREETAIANAVPTAEGALAIAMAEVPYTIHGARCLVLGYGRIGKALAKTLHAVGAEVTVAARKPEDLAWIRANDCHPLPFDTLLHSKTASDAPPLPFDIVFNTVPTQILGPSLIPHFPQDTLFVDLASAPGGIDRSFAKEHGYHTVHALSLPGKTAPVTAGKIIGDSIRQILRERLGDRI
ncbi:MAG: dipicolinate synthase subunit DpsA [Clostridia bacterium]|nr:dipicolinate synthase subunit DpsA [Clostridia bacterium]